MNFGIVAAQSATNVKWFPISASDMLATDRKLLSMVHGLFSELLATE